MTGTSLAAKSTDAPAERVSLTNWAGVLAQLDRLLEIAARHPRMLGWAGPILVMLLGGLLRFRNLSRPPWLVFDETYYVKEGASFLKYGFEMRIFPYGGTDANKTADSHWNAGDVNVFGPEPDFVVHPPVGKWMIAAGEHLFGVTNSFGWRFSAAVCGTLSILLLARIARRLFNSTLLGTTAGLLLAVEGQHFVHSRTSLLDIFVMFWALVAFGCIMLDRDQARARLEHRVTTRGLSTWGPGLGIRWWRFAAGVAIGLCTSTKWLGIFFGVAYGMTSVMWDVGNRRRVGTRHWMATGLLRDGGSALLQMLPVVIVIYFGSWFGWYVGPGHHSFHPHWSDKAAVLWTVMCLLVAALAVGADWFLNAPASTATAQPHASPRYLSPWRTHSPNEDVVIFRGWYVLAGIAVGLGTRHTLIATVLIGLVLILGLYTTHRRLTEHQLRSERSRRVAWGAWSLVTVVGTLGPWWIANRMTWTWAESVGGWGRQWADTRPATGLGTLVPNAIRSLWHYHAEMWHFNTTLSTPHAYQSNPWSWLLQTRPTAFDYRGYPTDTHGCDVADKCTRAIANVGNPLIWWLGVAALVVVVVAWLLRRDWRAGAIFAGYAGGYLPWFLFQNRTIYTFYTVAFSPYVVLALTFTIGLILGRSNAAPRRRMIGASWAGGIVLVCVLAFMYFYPIWTDMMIPYQQWYQRMWLPSWI